MRSIGIGTAVCAGALVLAFTTVSLAQTAPDSGGLPPPPAAPQTAAPASGSLGPGVAVASDGTAAPVSGNQPKDSAQKAAEEPKKAPKKLPWHGSTLLFDQSTTTQTVGIGKDYNSSNPMYELWFSLRPRYYFIDTERDTLNLNLRMDLIQELTNSDSSTYRNEANFGNIWVNLGYGHAFIKNPEKALALTVSTGPRWIIPTDKYSYMAGGRGSLGWTLGASGSLPLAGAKATWFPSLGLSASGAYSYSLNRTTTGENTDFQRTRQDSGGRPLISSQISSGARVEHQGLVVAGANLSVTEKLSVGLTYIWILQWTYKFNHTNNAVNTASGPVPAANIPDPVNFRVLPWFLTSVDYDLLPEVALGVGYYNLSNQIGEDGVRRSPLWSPEARVFFDVTANLDEIYNTVSGRRAAVESQASKARTRQQARATMLGSSL